jgi:hypothetical protein
VDRGGSDVDAQAGSRRVLRVMMGCRSVSALCMERVKAEFGSMMPIVSLRDCVRWKRGAVLDFVITQNSQSVR